MSRKRIIFVRVENSNLGQMAETFAQIRGGDQVEAFSGRLMVSRSSEALRRRKHE